MRRSSIQKESVERPDFSLLSHLIWPSHLAGQQSPILLAIGADEGFTCISTLIGANMRMVLQGQRQTFLKLGRKRLADAVVITRLETGEKARNGSSCDLENI